MIWLVVRIELAVSRNELVNGKNKELKELFDAAKQKNGRLHLLGLVSDGGVHSHIKHLLNLLDAARIAGIPKTFIHFFADGRDTSPRSASKWKYFTLEIISLATYLSQLLDHIKQHNYGHLTSIVY